MKFHIEKPQKINFRKINLNKKLNSLKNSLKKNKEIIEKILTKENKYNWDNLCQPIEELNNIIIHDFFPISHINSTKNNSKSRKIYKESLLLISKFNNWIGQYQPLYDVYKEFKKKSSFNNLNKIQQKYITNKIIDFELSGVNLSGEKKKIFKNISIKINKLENLFNNNVLDSTINWKKLIVNKNQLKGIPKNVLLSAKNLAKINKKKGWLFTLNTPDYISIMKYADDEDLKKEIYYAYNTRASSNNINNLNQWDNTDIILEILSLRNESAKLLGFKNYAEKSIYTKMAESTQEIFYFINKLNHYAYKKGKKELEKLIEFTKKYYNVKEIKPWNFNYYSEKQKKKIYSINNKEIKKFFPEKKVIHGIFKIIQKIYGIKIEKYNNNKNWHEDVRSFKVYNKKNNLIGKLNLDLYFRTNKNQGAWMDDSIGKFQYHDGKYQNPIANIICNFNKYKKNKQFLLNHEEIITLFHEFGHALHHLLTKINILSISGINGVPWDAVEIPSQLMENWCWQEKVLKMLSCHYKKNTTIPQITIKNILKTKNYQSGIFILNQLKFSLFDIVIHSECNIKNNNEMKKILEKIQKKVSIIKNPIWNNFPNTFTHIFNGNYAAGYYGYLWSDVLASDIFSKFKKEGIFDKKTGLSFLNNFLSLGGSEDPKKMINKFLGRNSNIKAMLKKYDI